MWSVIHKVVAVNEWRCKIMVEIDKSCPRCNPQLVESVEHGYTDAHSLNKGGNTLPTSFGSSLPKKMNLSLWKHFFYDAMPFFNNMQWPIERARQVIWDALQLWCD